MYYYDLLILAKKKLLSAILRPQYCVKSPHVIVMENLKRPILHVYQHVRIELGMLIINQDLIIFDYIPNSNQPAYSFQWYNYGRNVNIYL